MSGKGKIKPEEKVKIVELYINGEIGIYEAYRLYKRSKDSVKAIDCVSMKKWGHWRKKYKKYMSSIRIWAIVIFAMN